MESVIETITVKFDPVARRPMLYSHFVIFSILIFGRGGYNNAQPAKSYFGCFRFGSGTFWECPVCEI